MPINDIGTHPPYGTAWNGLDDDGDWEEWADEFEWRDDKNNDCLPGVDVSDPCWADPGEWGFVYWHTSDNNINDTLGYYIYEPDEIIKDKNMNIITVQET